MEANPKRFEKEGTISFNIKLEIVSLKGLFTILSRLV